MVGELVKKPEHERKHFLYGGLHQKSCTPISQPTGLLMGQKPKELPKAHSHAHAKGYDNLGNRHGKSQIVMPEPKMT